MKKRERFVLLSLLAASLGFNFLLLASPLDAGDTESYHRYQHLLQKVFYFVKNKHVVEVGDQQLLIGAIRGLLSSTKDPYTRFLDKNEHRAFNNAEEGRKVGVGVEVTMKNGVPLIIAPIAGGPAARAGIQPGDRIVAIDGVKTRRKSFQDILKLIAGEIGQVVILEVKREGQKTPLKVPVKRGLFNLEYVKTAYLEKEQLGYIKLLQFFGEESGSVEMFRKALLDFKSKKVKGLVLDLRNNTGGHLQMAATLTGYFLSKGQLIVSARGRTEAGSRLYHAGKDAGIFPKDIPMVVLINRGSASASEIMAGALQDYGRAVLIGDQSYGKGSVQQIIRPLPDDTAALITIQKYYTPKDRSIHGIGLKPDLKVGQIKPNLDETYYLNKMVELKFWSAFKKENPTFSAAILEKFQSKTKAKGWNFSKNLSRLLLRRAYGKVNYSKPEPDLDPQLARALKHLNQ